jgi:hypothetical protein
MPRGKKGLPLTRKVPSSSMIACATFGERISKKAEEASRMRGDVREPGYSRRASMR